MRLRWLVITMASGAALLAPTYGGWALFDQSSRPIAAETLPERAQTASMSGSAPAGGSFLVAARGRVETVSEELDLAIGLVGTLAAVYVEEGAAVKQGQLLAELVNGDQSARVAEAEAQVKLRKAELEKLLHGARPEERRQAAAQLEKMRAGVALAKQELARRGPLAATGIATRQSWDQAVSSAQVAEADEAGNRAALEMINAPPRVEDVAMAEANLAFAEANVQEQRVLLQKTQLRSPLDGVVLRRYLRTGETISVQPLIPILQVGDTSRLRVRTEIDETEVSRVQLGQRAWVTAPAFPNQKFFGRVSRISNRMGRKTVRSDEPTDKADTNVLDAFVDFEQPGLQLPVGLRVNVFFDSAAIAER
jgi:HlyD family secretion protein